MTPILRLPLRLRSPVGRSAPVHCRLDWRAIAPALPVPLPRCAHLLSGGFERGIDIEVGDEPAVWTVSWVAEPDDLACELQIDAARPPVFRGVTVEPELADAALFRVDGQPRAVLHCAGGQPFWHPVIGPADLSLTRLGLPTEPDGRTHRHGLWIGHPDVEGVNCWDTRSDCGRQELCGWDGLADGGASARLAMGLRWVSPDGRVLLDERRTARLWALPYGETLLELCLHLSSPGGPVRLARTPFGLMGLRVAQALQPDRGGRIDSAVGSGGEDALQHRRARWCDWSGSMTADQHNGVALLDRPSNPDYPTYWHVRDDGWMGASACYAAELVVAPHRPLRLDYAVLLHNGDAAAARVDELCDMLADPPRVEVGALLIQPTD